MANEAVALYQYVKIAKKWRFQTASAPLIKLGENSYYVSWYEGMTKQMERVGPGPKQAERRCCNRELLLVDLLCVLSICRTGPAPETGKEQTGTFWSWPSDNRRLSGVRKMKRVGFREMVGTDRNRCR